MLKPHIIKELFYIGNGISRKTECEVEESKPQSHGDFKEKERKTFLSVFLATSICSFLMANAISREDDFDIAKKLMIEIILWI